MKFPIYLDYSATTPVDPRVVDKMIPFLYENFGNAASTSHEYGWKAKEAVENARAEVAALINAIRKKSFGLAAPPKATTSRSKVQLVSIRTKASI